MAECRLQTGSAVRHTLLLLVSLLASLSAYAGTWGSRGYAQSFEVRGTLLYSADGRGVTVYDVSDPANVRQLDVESGDDESHDAAFLDDATLVLATSAGVEWFDVNADGSLDRGGRTALAGGVRRVAGNGHFVAAGGPKEIALLEMHDGVLERRRTMPARGPVRDLVFIGDFLYATYETGGLDVFNALTGVRVERIGMETPTLALDGTTLWVASGQSGLFSFDVSNPAAPRALATRADASLIDAGAIAVSGTHAYVADLPDTIRIYDITDRTLPRQIATVTDWVNVIGASGNRFFTSGVAYDRQHLPVAIGSAVRVYELSGATAALAGEYKDFAGPVSGVFTDGTLAYVVDAPYLRIIDVSKTDQPRELSSVLVPDTQDRIRVRNGLAIIYGRSNVNLVDVSDIYAPRYLSTYDSKGHPASAAALLRDTFVEGNEHSGLHIVDYSDPSRPVQIAGRIMHYHDVAAGDDAVYALQQSVFMTFDLSNRRAVVLTAEKGPIFYAQIDTVPPNVGSPEYLVTSRPEGMHVFSLRENRFAPRLIGSIDLSEPGVFGTSETSAFIAKDGSLLRLDVAAPTELVETGLRVTSPMQISAAGAKVVVADRYWLRVYGPDTAPPPAPEPEPPARRRAAGH